ncbi:hypothetical protein CGC20_31710 [Leishmania donovani]|uniref:Uncharacterized protein n=1 Tax=Leishmania donovani TaxID=5661 RepID=A0A504XD45_LEIDO|nr:hypothetical protein CGC20_31710 [Leishmania donovani]
MQECERCAHELSSTAGMAYRIRPKHPEAGRARLMDEKGAKRLDTDQPHSACARSMRHPLHVTGWADEAQTPEASRQHRELHQRGLSEGPGLRLANLLPELIGHAPRPIPYYPHGRRHRHRPRAGPWTRPAQVKACSSRKAAWRRSRSTYLTKG